jgi:hypothetical protein
VQKTQHILSKTKILFAEKSASESFDISCTLTVGNKPLFATEIIVNSNSTIFLFAAGIIVKLYGIFLLDLPR